MLSVLAKHLDYCIPESHLFPLHLCPISLLQLGIRIEAGVVGHDVLPVAVDPCLVIAVRQLDAAVIIGIAPRLHPAIGFAARFADAIMSGLLILVTLADRVADM